MKYLLDTHTFLWWCMGADQISPPVCKILADGHNEIYLSAASAWEIAIKAAKGRLSLPEDPSRYVTSRMNQHRFLALPVQISHALRVSTLPAHHLDPFDRLLIAQSQLERMPLLSQDQDITRYDVTVIW